MRIGLDAWPLTQSYGGVGTYTRYLLKALLEVGPGHEFVAYLPTDARPDLLAPPAPAPATLSYRKVGKLAFRWRGRLDALDVYHGTNFKLQTHGRLGSVVTIHDLWLDRHPEYSKKLFGQRLSFYRTRLRARGAARVITGSHHTARDIEELYGVPRERISVIHHGIAPQFYVDEDPVTFARLRARIHLAPGPYILFVGGADPRKNHETLWEAFARQDRLKKEYWLVAAGSPHHRLGSLAVTAHRMGISDRLVIAGPVSADDLRLLYSHASLFVFPSRHEGFGLPVLEAMACGAPVVTSSSTSLPEVAGDAAILIHPDSVEELGAAMCRVAGDGALRERLRQQGFARVQQFGWETAARRTLQVYQEICGSG